MRVWVSTRRRLSRLSVESLCLPACLLGRLSVCRGRVASETYAKLLTQKATKRNANTARTVRKERRSEEEKQRKSCRLRLYFTAASADAYAGADCAAGVRL